MQFVADEPCASAKQRRDPRRHKQRDRENQRRHGRDCTHPRPQDGARVASASDSRSGERVSRVSIRDRRPRTDLLRCPDDRVMQELQAGNNDAFAVILRRYRRLVHLTALRILRDAYGANARR